MKDTKVIPPKYTTTCTHDIDIRYDFLFDGADRDTFTKEQVSLMLERINFALTLFDDAYAAVDNATDVIDWLNRDILEVDKD